jgi:hypothetical protein
MRVAAEYRKHAEECRRLAQQVVAPEDKRALEDLAETWEMLERLSDRDLVNRTEPFALRANQDIERRALTARLSFRRARNSSG